MTESYARLTGWPRSLSEGPLPLTTKKEHPTRFLGAPGVFVVLLELPATLRGNEGDVDSIIPNLYASRARPIKKTKEPVVEETTSASESAATCAWPPQ